MEVVMTHTSSKEYLDKVKATKESLYKYLKGRYWMRGVSLSKDEKGFFLTVNISSFNSDVPVMVPDERDGVRIKLRLVKDITK